MTEAVRAGSPKQAQQILIDTGTDQARPTGPATADGPRREDR
ncbi:hypothetical protein AB0A94_18615 [Streptomyces sp. NPDC044984]